MLVVKILLKTNEPCHEKTHSHPRSLVSALVVRCLDSILAKCKITSEAEQAGLTRVLPGHKPGRHFFFLFHGSNVT